MGVIAIDILRMLSMAWAFAKALSMATCNRATMSAGVLAGAKLLERGHGGVGGHGLRRGAVAGHMPQVAGR